MTSEQHTPPAPRPARPGEAWHWIGAALIFVAEMLTLLALAWWGFTAIHGPVQVLVGLGLPAAVATLWGLALAPRARYHWPAYARIPARTAILVIGGLTLLAVGATALSWIELIATAVGTFLTLRFPAPDAVESRTKDVGPGA